MQLTELTATEQSALLAKGELSARELIEATLRRIEAVEPRIGAYNTVMAEQALAGADAADAARRAGTAGPMAGIPIAVKDNICTLDSPTTCSSRILAGYVSPYEATVVTKLKAAGYIPIGKANMDEFAMGSSNENSATRTVANPWDLTRVPGGSSGGSVAAVAAGEATVALGSDTGGSIRLPASYCGVVGLKPTYGMVSRYGLVAFASSLDQIGPISRSVADNARLLQAIAGHDPRDSTSLPGSPTDFAAQLTAGVKGLRVGVPAEMMGDGVAPDVTATVQRAIAALKEQGAEIVEVSLPHSQYALPIYYLICTAEASSNLARYDGVRYGPRAADAQDLEDLYVRSRSAGFGPEVKRRIMLGTYALSAGYYDAFYGRAMQGRTLIIQDFVRAFAAVDVLISPTAPDTAFKLGEKVNDPLSMYLADVMTTTVNLAGLPSLSVPGGFDRLGLPIGIQLIGPAMGEPLLYRVAATLESTLGVSERRPTL
ncbi:MAG: Asp-tRNA(Asn)/Glu-tRNA(Gln) amidotransferase subunit GatA [Candidatus Sericytochromatia bacterium]|nr:Asp-tRNA(Asn)/Glu-tRNA(Gln) amidotransferase subunit GatA [Candidatus Sericytochromatia bacterium]